MCVNSFGSNKPMVPTAPTAPKELPPAFALRRHIGQSLDRAGGRRNGQRATNRRARRGPRNTRDWQCSTGNGQRELIE